jgi:hypothetical protein
MRKSRPPRARRLLLAFLFGVLAARAGQEPVGPMARSEVLKARPDWAAVAASYRPRPDALERVRSFPQPLQIEVFFRLDTADCRDFVGRLFRLQDALDAGRVTVRLIAVSADLKRPQEEILSLFIESVPTLTVRVDGYELGRIVGLAAGTLEEELDALLATYIRVEDVNFDDRESMRGFKHNLLPIACTPCHGAGRFISTRSSSGTRLLPR